MRLRITSSRALHLAVALAVGLAVGCSGLHRAEDYDIARGDAVASDGVGADAALDVAPSDAGPPADIPADSAPGDASADGDDDALVDVSSDVPVDVSSDVPVDVPADAAPDDARVDAVADAGVDVSVDAQVDAGSDAQVDSASDALVDVPADTEPGDARADTLGDSLVDGASDVPDPDVPDPCALADPDPDAAGGCEVRACDPVAGWVTVPDPSQVGQPCDDGDVCTVETTCAAGACGGGSPLPDPAPGAAGPCELRACDPGAGWSSVADVSRDDEACDDGDACTGDGTCAGGVCQGGPAVDCGDGDPCTDDTCDSAEGCQHAANAAPCDDEDACTTGDSCFDFACVGVDTSAADCDDDDPCTDDTCDAEAGCQHAPNTAPCNDGDTCTTGDTCSELACVGVDTSVTDCDDGDPCTDGACDPAVGCTHETLIDGTPCTESCAMAGTCQSGVCVGGALECPKPACSAGGQVDVNPPLACASYAFGGACDALDCDVGCLTLDFDEPTDLFSQLVYQGGQSYDAPVVQGGYLDFQHAGALGTTSAIGHFELDGDFELEVIGDLTYPASDPTDHDTTIGLARCDSAGRDVEDEFFDVMQGYTIDLPTEAGQAPDSTVEFRCVFRRVGPFVIAYYWRDAAFEPLGQWTVPEDGPPLWFWAKYQDQTSSSEGSFRIDSLRLCRLGCGDPPPACDDGDPCTDDVWSEVTASCFHVPVGGPCDDGDACTTGDVCSDGVCAGVDTSAVDCDDGDPCTDDACDGASGCLHPFNIAPCDDQSDCTTDDECQDGACVGTYACLPSDVCFDDACCTPGCAGRECGGDGCGGSCGECFLDEVCGPEGVCAPAPCDPADCPTLADYTAACNVHEHCEYTYSGGDPAAWRAWDVLLWVPPGPFPMGSPFDEPVTTSYPEHDVTLAAGYFIDKYELTAGAFAAWLTDRGSAQCAYAGVIEDCLRGDANLRILWDGATATLLSDCQRDVAGTIGTCSDHPLTYAGWHAAGAYCAEHGRRLCSEAEWERAAKGRRQRTWPWGEELPDATRMNGNCIEGPCDDGYLRTAPVGTFPAGASPVGALDMAGNVWEWVEDDYRGDYYAAPVDGTAWVDVPRAADRVLRGGSCYHDGPNADVTYRIASSATTVGYEIGLRCCREAATGGR